MPRPTMMRKLQNSGATFGMVSSAAGLLLLGRRVDDVGRVLLQQQAEAEVVLVLLEQRARCLGLLSPARSFCSCA